MEQKNKNNKSWLLGALVLVLALGVLGWYIYTRETSFKNTSEPSADNATTTVNIGGVTLEIPPGSKVSIETDNSSNIGPAPKLDRPVVFPTNFPQEARPLWLKNFADLKTQLAKTPQSYDLWLQVGLDWKMIGDYESAREAWEYAAKLSPKASVAFGNLGFLYGYYLHDNIKAEADFKTALTNSPQELYIYQQTFEFYRDVLKDPAKARQLASNGARITGNKEFFDKLISTLLTL